MRLGLTREVGRLMRNKALVPYGFWERKYLTQQDYEKIRLEVTPLHNKHQKLSEEWRKLFDKKISVWQNFSRPTDDFMGEDGKTFDEQKFYAWVEQRKRAEQPISRKMESISKAQNAIINKILQTYNKYE